MNPAWVREERDGDEVVFRLGRDGSIILAEWPGVATYRSDRTPRLCPVPGADADRVSKLAFGAARVLDRALEGRWSFHASAVVRDEGVVMVVGASGAGKSTAAAALVRGGGLLLADDVAFVDESEGALMVVPGETSHWLHPLDAQRLDYFTPSTERTKVRVAATSTSATPVRLETIIELVEDEGTGAFVVEPLSGADAMRAVSTALFLLPSVDGQEGHAVEHLDFVARVVRRASVVRVRRPTLCDPRSLAEVITRARMTSR